MKDETPSFDFGEQDDTEHAQAGKRSCESRQARGAADPEAQRIRVEVQLLGAPPDTESTWTEVPQSRFFSWPPAMQAAYCRDRDLDSAEHDENEEWREFYTQRAESYRQ